VFQFHYFLVWPVEVIGNEGYLLVQRIERVANYPPTGTASG